MPLYPEACSRYSSESKRRYWSEYSRYREPNKGDRFGGLDRRCCGDLSVALAPVELTSGFGIFAPLTSLLLAASATLSYTRHIDLCCFTRLVSALVLFRERALHRLRNRSFDDFPRGLRPVKPFFLPHVLSSGSNRFNELCVLTGGACQICTLWHDVLVC